MILFTNWTHPLVNCKAFRLNLNQIHPKVHLTAKISPLACDFLLDVTIYKAPDLTMTGRLSTTIYSIPQTHSPAPHYPQTGKTFTTFIWVADLAGAVKGGIGIVRNYSTPSQG